MYLMTRRTRVKNTEGLDWAIKILGHAKEVTNNEIQLWSTVYSAGFGTITWTSWWADLASMETAFLTLQADEGYNKLASDGRELTDGIVDDELIQTISGEANPGSQAQYVGSVRAVCAAGNIVRAMTAGIEIAQKVEAITGTPTLFVRGLTGPYGNIGWLTPYENLAAVGTSQDKLAADQGWLTYLDGLAGCFVEDASITQQTLYQKLA